MGVFARGPSAGMDRIDVQGIAAVMRPALEAWMTAHIQILDPKRPSGPTTIVMDSGANGALIQPLRAPTSITSGGQTTNLIGIRFQVKRAEVAEGQHLRGGLLVKVLDGGNDMGLVGPVYSLGETIDSSLAWDYIFEASVVSGGY